MSKFHQSTPLLVLACRSGAVEADSCMTLQDIIEGLKLQNMKWLEGIIEILSDLLLLSFSPWGVFDVCCDNMRGMEKGLDWVLHHLAKKRREWTYHSMQGQNG